MWDRPLVYIERITDKAQDEFARYLVANFVDEYHISLSLIQERSWAVVPGETGNHFAHEDAALLSQALHSALLDFWLKTGFLSTRLCKHSP